MPSPPGRVVCLGITSLDADARRRIETALGPSVEWHDSAAPDPLWTDPDAVTALLVALPVKLDRAALQRMPALKFINVFGTSTSNLDMKAATEAGVTICRVQHYCDEETAEFTSALLLAGLRGILFPERPTASLEATRVGVVGLGQVGSIVARQMAAMGATVVPIRRSEPNRLERIGQCDAISLHGPRDVVVFGEAEFAALRPDAGLVNTCNGTAVSEDALRRWLTSGDGWMALDAVAARTYGHLVDLAADRVYVSARAAYRTPTSVARRREQFIANVESWARRSAR